MTEDVRTSHSGRWGLLSETATIIKYGVHIERTSVWGLRATEALFRFADIGVHQIRHTDKPSPLWLVVAGLFGIGVVSNLTPFDVSNLAPGVLIILFTLAMWLQRRLKWIGQPPLFILDKGQRSLDFLDEVMRETRCHQITRIAAHSTSLAYSTIDEWRSVDLIDPREATELRRLIEPESNPSGYL